MIIFLIAGTIFSKSSLSNPGFGRKSETFVLDASQFPKELRKNNPAKIYLLYNGKSFSHAKSDPLGLFFRGDTIINLKGFTDSLNEGIKGYRLIFENHNSKDSSWQTNSASGPKTFVFRPNFLDSVLQVDTKFRISDKAYNLGDDLLHILAYDSSMKVVDDFVYYYLKKLILAKPVPSEIILTYLLREYEVYNSYDRNRYSVNAVWSLSIGINIKPDQFKGLNVGGVNCETDAISYNNFFKEQFHKKLGSLAETSFREYVLLGKDATKEAILTALKDIAAKASPKDYFIFNFSGFTSQISLDSSNSVTYFFPYDKKGYPYDMFEGNNIKKYAGQLDKQLISLNILQEYTQQIQADNQLFISEAGESKKFKTEFIRTLMQNSPEVAGILNKNRIIIVPNSFGRDDVSCNNQMIKKGPINYFITSLDSAYNIYDIFKEGRGSDQIAYEIKNVQNTCKSFSYNYFDIFFEKQFLQQYKEIFGDGVGQTRGLTTKSNEIQETVSSLTGKHYALVVGTDNYKAKGWNKLSNPIKDAKAVADELSNSYGFEVQLMEDRPMDTIYKAIREYYRIAKPNDQLVVYFAGHGDVDVDLLSDGFIVCADSKSVDDDPVRNSYIPFTKLQKMLNNIPARQVLLLLDVCHGGTFDPKYFDNIKNEKREGEFSNISNKNLLQFLKDKLPLRTRKFLSSVGAEPAFDGKAGQHSPFANLLLQVLRTRGSNSNGIIKVSDIFTVLQTASTNETAVLKIAPDMNDFGKVDAYTEFIFIPVEKVPTKE